MSTSAREPGRERERFWLPSFRRLRSIVCLVAGHRIETKRTRRRFIKRCGFCGNVEIADAR